MREKCLARRFPEWEKLALAGVPPSPLPSESLAWRGFRKTCLQNLDAKELRGQNLENKGLRGPSMTQLHSVRPTHDRAMATAEARLDVTIVRRKSSEWSVTR